MTDVSETVKLTIDEREVEVPKGTNLIAAAESIGVDIPHFCYHSHLSVAGNCRMCTVEIENMRGLPIACNTICTEGMAVKTDTEKVLETRAAVMEFLLVNHPIDCPVCDQAGECKLQIYYMEHDRRDSVVPLEDKVEKGKAIEVGPRVMLDQERCVACTRCIRFCDEVTGTGELRLLNRGDHTTIDTFPGRALDNNYSVNTADICPVGALTSRDFRFQARVWFLKSDPSVCPGCATGCNTTVSHYKQTELGDYNGVAYRLRPRVNEEVNQAWMCDFGRREYRQVNDRRLRQPVAHSVEVGWDGALSHVAKALRPIVEAGTGAADVAAVASYDATNEEIWQLRRLMREVFGQERIAVLPMRADGFEDSYLIDADKHPNRFGTLAVGGAGVATDAAAYLSGKKAVIVLGANPMAGVCGEDVTRAFGEIRHKVVLAANESETTELATVILPTVSYAEKDGTWVNRQGRVQRLRRILAKRFDCKDELAALRLLAGALGRDWEEQSAAEVFAELAAEVKPLRGLSYAKIGDLGAPSASVTRVGAGQGSR